MTDDAHQGDDGLLWWDLDDVAERLARFDPGPPPERTEQHHRLVFPEPTARRDRATPVARATIPHPDDDDPENPATDPPPVTIGSAGPALVAPSSTSRAPIVRVGGRGERPLADATDAPADRWAPPETETPAMPAAPQSFTLGQPDPTPANLATILVEMGLLIADDGAAFGRLASLNADQLALLRQHLAGIVADVNPDNAEQEDVDKVAIAAAAVRLIGVRQNAIAAEATRRRQTVTAAAAAILEADASLRAPAEPAQLPSRAQLAARQPGRTLPRPTATRGVLGANTSRQTFTLTADASMATPADSIADAVVAGFTREDRRQRMEPAPPTPEQFIAQQRAAMIAAGNTPADVDAALPALRRALGVPA